jgi:hypothetical protein
MIGAWLLVTVSLQTGSLNTEVLLFRRKANSHQQCERVAKQYREVGFVARCLKAEPQWLSPKNWRK